MADARAEYGEMNITKLNQRIDGIEVNTVVMLVMFDAIHYMFSNTTE
jgi:hypothetical protein